VNNDDPNIPRNIAKAVWNIVTALRGPDSDNESLKRRTTQRLRGVIGLRSGNAGGCLLSLDKPTSFILVGDFARKYDEKSHHFANHYRYAVEGLAEIGFIKKIEYED